MWISGVICALPEGLVVGLRVSCVEAPETVGRQVQAVVSLSLVVFLH